MTQIREFAPAKLNLYLHITGRRADGYHDLDSLVGFAGIGDELLLSPADKFSFSIAGKMAGTLAQENIEDNLAVRAMRSLAALVGRELDAQVELVKNLPVASGIGGGSSDAAAALRALARHWGLAAADARLTQAAAQHGQDVPVCLTIENKYMTADGTIAAPKLPQLAAVLVNPDKALPTPAVYRAYKESGGVFSPVARLTEAPRTAEALIAALKLRGNDLYPAACRLMPDIGEMIEALSMSDHCLLARMSGSGATCFGIYGDAGAAEAAARKIKTDNPLWWVEATMINQMFDFPQIFG